MVEIVEIVWSGSVGSWINLKRISANLGSNAEYNPEISSGLCLRFGKDSPVITVYRSGKYTVTETDSQEKADAARERFLKFLTEKGVISKPDDQWFRIENLVCVTEIGESLDLNAVAVCLGFEYTEYKPKQFHALIYRRSETEDAVLLFESGRVMIMGSPSLNAAEETYEHLQDKLAELLNSNY